MGVYDRYKRDPSGFRKMVELLETTPISRRQRMIEVGMDEDPEYTRELLSYMITFEDVLNLPDLELAELLSSTPPRVVATAIAKASVEVRERFTRNTLPRNLAEMRDSIEAVGVDPPLREIGGAQLKMIEFARKLEKTGKIKSKRIPEGAGRKMVSSEDEDES